MICKTVLSLNRGQSVCFGLGEWDNLPNLIEGGVQISIGGCGKNLEIITRGGDVYSGLQSTHLCA